MSIRFTLALLGALVPALTYAVDCHDLDMVGTYEFRGAAKGEYTSADILEFKRTTPDTYDIVRHSGNSPSSAFYRRFNQIRLVPHNGTCYLVWMKGGAADESNRILDHSAAGDLLVLGGDFEMYPVALVKRLVLE